MPDEELLHIAESLVDDRPVDWTKESTSHPNANPAIVQLRRIESLISAHRSNDPGAATSAAASRPLDPTLAIKSAPVDSQAAAIRTWGPLEIRARLGGGAFGSVYRANDPSLQCEVALKLMRSGRNNDEPDVKRFISEARRLARVRHANVLIVHGVATHDGQTGIWTELVKGKTLDEYLDQERRLGSREAALIGIDLCHALAAVHSAGLIHRDIKPSNVMREEGGRIVLMDFGSGGDLPKAGVVARSGHAYGTPLCMAPEQLHGEVAGPPTDIYALGVLLYRAVAGRYPIEAASLDDLMEKHRRRALVPLRDSRPDLPVDFVRVVEKALAFDPKDRFPSAGAFEQALASTLGSQTADAPARATQRIGRGSRTSRLAWAAAVVLLAVAGVALFTPRQASRPHSAKALTASVELFRDKDGVAERLTEGTGIEPGHDLYMSIEGSDSMYVYVLDEDDEGNLFVLFPVSGISPANPLAPGRRHRCPGSLGSEPVNWEVTSAGGEERILVLASRAPLENLERELRSFPNASPGAPIHYGQLSADAVSSLRGIGGFSSGARAGVEEHGRLSQVLAQVSASVGGSGGGSDLWVWQIGLKNPAR